VEEHSRHLSVRLGARIRLRPPHFASWEANFLRFGGGAGAITAVGSWLAIKAMEGEMPLGDLW
jgi:hypothetical protein